MKKTILSFCLSTALATFPFVGMAGDEGGEGASNAPEDTTVELRKRTSSAGDVAADATPPAPTASTESWGHWTLRQTADGWNRFGQGMQIAGEFFDGVYRPEDTRPAEGATAAQENGYAAQAYLASAGAWAYGKAAMAGGFVDGQLQTRLKLAPTWKADAWNATTSKLSVLLASVRGSGKSEPEKTPEKTKGKKKD